MITEASSSKEAKILEVVLFPCAPATAKTRLSSKIRGKASLRESHSMPNSLAYLNSEFSSLIAAE